MVNLDGSDDDIMDVTPEGAQAAGDDAGAGEERVVVEESAAEGQFRSYHNFGFLMVVLEFWLLAEKMESKVQN
jgi:hypothetical protein